VQRIVADKTARRRVHADAESSHGLHGSPQTLFSQATSGGNAMGGPGGCTHRSLDHPPSPTATSPASPASFDVASVELDDGSERSRHPVMLNVNIAKPATHRFGACPMKNMSHSLQRECPETRQLTDVVCFSSVSHRLPQPHSSAPLLSSLESHDRLWQRVISLSGRGKSRPRIHPLPPTERSP
jgi:hypothetical protein